MHHTAAVHRRTRASRRPVTFRLRADLIRLVEAIAEKEGESRTAVLERWVTDRLEGSYPGCAGEQIDALIDGAESPTTSQHANGRTKAAALP